MGDVFYILLYGSNKLPIELDEIRRLDWRLLDMDSFVCVEPDDVFSDLFEDPSRAGQYTAHGGNFVTLAKQIVSMIFYR